MSACRSTRSQDSNFLLFYTVDTVQEWHSTIQSAVKEMRGTNHPITAVVPAGELFSRFITLAKFDDKTVEECKVIMLERGQLFLKKLLEARNIIAKQCAQFVTDGCVSSQQFTTTIHVILINHSKYLQRVLTHARSRVVLETLKVAAKCNKRFHVFVTQSSPDNTGKQMCDELTEAKIECTLILDSAIGYIMESIDIVLVGAEGVVESGGIINRVGTFTMALCAREMKKPFYVLAESLKFSRLYPLNQRDLPNDYKYPKHCLQKDLLNVHPLVDYTSPAYITLLFTDIGILTPSAISDELIKLYL